MLDNEDMRACLQDALNKIDVAKATQGAFGGMSNMAAAEIASGRFLAMFGPALLAGMGGHGAGQARH